MAVTASWESSSEAICQARLNKWTEILTENSSPRWRQRRADAKDQPVSNLTAAMQAQFESGLKEENILWQFVMEDDSAGTGFPQDILTGIIRIHILYMTYRK